jgi:RimJ/RimL family protein N-acetyltransferase
VCNRQANARYWGIWLSNKNTDTEDFIGMCGLENISWENRNAEISIILNPEYQSKGYGNEAVKLLLDQGFNYLNLENIWGECYFCSPAIDFWKKICKEYNGTDAILPNRKYWNETYYNSMYFNINKSDYKERDI